MGCGPGLCWHVAYFDGCYTFSQCGDFSSRCVDAPPEVVWQRFLPAVQPVLLALGWWISADGHAVCRTDSTGVQRQVLIGFDSISILHESLADWHRTRLLRTCGRLKQSLHRNDPAGELASGPELPGVPPSAICLFRGHVAAWACNSSPLLRKAALATGGSFWGKFPFFKEFAENDPRHKCLCGADQPSRAHLLWSCPQTASFREGWRLPVSRLEERLFGVVVPERPPPPVVFPFDHSLLADALINDAASFQGQIIAATDGASVDQVAAWSIVVPRTSHSFSGGIASEDQGPYRAEIMAIVTLLQALLLGLQRGASFSNLLIIADCTSAIEAFHGRGSARRLVDWCSDLLHQVHQFGVVVSFQWVPSHGKRKLGWSPSCGLDEQLLRDFNEWADKVARAKAMALLNDSARATYASERRCALDWEYRTVSLAALVAARYDSYEH